jgi:hypothetical protein
MPLLVLTRQKVLAGHMDTNSEPLQRTDISTQPLGPTLLDVLNCGFHKIRGERAKFQPEAAMAEEKSVTHLFATMLE